MKEKEANVFENMTKDYNKIIGFLINETIYTGLDAVSLVTTLQNYDRLISLAEAKFMAACDLGKKWEDLAKCKTILKIDDKGDAFLDEECLLFGGK